MPVALLTAVRRWRVKVGGPSQSAYLFDVSLIRRNDGPPYEHDDETWRTVALAKPSHWLWGHEVMSYEGDYHRYGLGPFQYVTGPW